PGLLVYLGWPAAITLGPAAGVPSARRLVHLQAVCLQPGLWRPLNRAEQQTLHALRRATYRLMSILQHDPHSQVRFSVALVIEEILSQDQRAILHPNIRGAFNAEPDPALRDVLARLV
ncbi:MAG: hypothetical protein ACLFTK_18095, partial [Anaerolineales bacterium]